MTWYSQWVTKNYIVLWRFLGISITEMSNQEVKRIKYLSVWWFYVKWIHFILISRIPSWDITKNLKSAIRPCTKWPPSQIISILLIALLSLNDIALHMFFNKYILILLRDFLFFIFQEQAFDASQKYKEGKYIIELAHMIKENGWDNSVNWKTKYYHVYWSMSLRNMILAFW